VKQEGKSRAGMGWISFFFFLTLLFAMVLMPHPAMVTRKVGTETSPLHFSGKLAWANVNEHIPGPF